VRPLGIACPACRVQDSILFYAQNWAGTSNDSPCHLLPNITRMTLYFAYGSNMGNKQMLVRCPNSRRLGPAQLPGWRWIIAADGYANVVPAVADHVEGILFELAAADEAALDLFEEVATGAYAKIDLPVSYQGNMTQALVYVGPLWDEGSAAPEYVLRLQAAFADAGLEGDYLARLQCRCNTVIKPGA
jgi:hypothetical protein